MGRAKLNLELIKKEKARHSTFQKRKSGLLKKISEFKILCDVDACMIIYGPPKSNSSAPNDDIEPEIWPNDAFKVREIVDKYKESRRGNNKEQEDPRLVVGTARRTTDLSDFYRDRERKAHSDLAKLRHKIGVARFPTWDDRLQGLDSVQLRRIGAMVTSKLLEADNRISTLKKGAASSSSLHHQRYLMAQSQGTFQDHYGGSSKNNYSDADVEQPYLDNKNMDMNMMAHQNLLPVEFHHPAMPLSYAPAPRSFVRQVDPITPSYLSSSLMHANENHNLRFGGGAGNGAYGWGEGLVGGGGGGSGSDHVVGVGVDNCHGHGENLQCMPWAQYSSDWMDLLDNMFNNAGPSMHY